MAYTYVKVNPTDIQSMLFDKAKWTVARAKKWLKGHGFRRSELGKTGPRSEYYHFIQFDPKKKFRYVTKMFGSPKSGMKAHIEFRGKRPAMANPSHPKRPAIFCNNPAHAHFRQTGTYARPRVNPREDGFRGGLGRTSEFRRSERVAPRIFRRNDPDPRAYRQAHAFGSSGSRFGRMNPSPYPETRARWERARIAARRAMA